MKYLDLSTFFDWIILALAVYSLMVAWFEGSLFATSRARFEAWATSPKWFYWFMGELLSCPLCLPPYLASILYVLGTYVPYGRDALCIYSASGVAASVYQWLRSRKSNHVIINPK